ncbi:MAG: hypothetical protein NVSMB70_01080 [Chamaesiphon sp.]
MSNDIDIAVAEHTSSDNEDLEMSGKAKQVAESLCKAYPNHLWMVGWAPGMTLVVKNMAIQDGRYGYTIDGAKSFSASDLNRMAVQAGGELLERCGVKRGAWDGEFMDLIHKD